VSEAISQEVLNEIAAAAATEVVEASIPEIDAVAATEAVAEPIPASDLSEVLQTKPPSDIVDWINALIYGDPGVGKTWFGGTADDDERTGPLLVLDVEGGVTTLRHRNKVEVIAIRSMKELEKVHEKLYHSIKNNRIKYGTVMIDSLPELADLDMRLIMRQAYQKNPETTDIDVPSPREWGKQRNHMRLIVRAFRDLPCHCIYTAQAGSHTDEGQPTKYYPAFAGKLRTEVPGFMDIVGYLTARTSPAGDINRTLQVVGTNRVIAKDRTSALGQVVENPTIPKLWDLINSHNERAGVTNE